MYANLEKSIDESNLKRKAAVAVVQFSWVSVTNKATTYKWATCAVEPALKQGKKPDKTFKSFTAKILACSDSQMRLSDKLYENGWYSITDTEIERPSLYSANSQKQTLQLYRLK